MTAASKIAIDWGSSAFRAFLLDENEHIIARTQTDDGVLQTNKKEFEKILSETCTHWHDEHGPVPIIMSGMIGSRNGWVETEYVPCPTSAINIASKLVPVSGQNSLTYIVPGVSGNNLFGSPDVMRGEEVQVFGALKILGEKDGIVCLPGTHSKWCVVKGGAIQSLTTFMTGEMFALMRTNSSLASLVAGEEFDQSSFLSGIDAGRSDAGLLNKLFSIRAGVLLDTLACQSYASYLSGMFIGHEIKAVKNTLQHLESVILVGNEGLTHRYTTALEAAGCCVTVVEADSAFLNGISLITQS